MFAGKIFGKDAFSYSPDRNYTRFEVKKFLKPFKLNEALRLIGKLSATLFYQKIDEADKKNKIINYNGEELVINNENIFRVGNVPINISILAYIAMCLIENAKDSNQKVFKLSDLRQIGNMYYGLDDPFFDNNDSKEALIRMGALQFEYELDWLHFLSRTIAIYKDIWPRLPECNQINIEQDIRDLSGLSFEEIAFLSWWFGREVCTKSIAVPDNPNVQIFNKTNIDKFVNWLSCDYERFREISNKDKQQYKKGELNIYEKYRFNSLHKFPIIKSDKNNGYVIPCMYLLSKRVTQGLYHEISEKYKLAGDKTNPFRRAFGAAFEEYIGILLRNSNPNFKVIKSPKYSYKKKQQKTVDWIVLEGDKAVLIEVKQSGLFLKAKTTGELQEIKESLKKTIAEGVKQIIIFEENVKSGKFQELQQFKHVKFFERLVITYDPIFFTANILEEEVKNILKGQIPQLFYWHVMSIEQFEHIVANKGLKFWEFLREKRISQTYKHQDFREYLFYKKSPINNEFLINLWKDFFSNQTLKKDLELLTGKQLTNFP